MTKSTVFYIENLGGQTLGNELMQRKNAGADITERSQMDCLGRDGRHRTRDLYEVPTDIKDRVMKMAETSGFTFNIYSRDSSKEDSLPREFISELVRKQVDPFSRAARTARRKKLARLPAGVMLGRFLASSRR